VGPAVVVTIGNRFFANANGTVLGKDSKTQGKRFAACHSRYILLDNNGKEIFAEYFLSGT